MISVFILVFEALNQGDNCSLTLVIPGDVLDHDFLELLAVLIEDSEGLSEVIKDSPKQTILEG
jgi:hypothetical protein